MAFANIDDQGRLADRLPVIFALHQQPGKRRKHRQRQVVDAEVSEILKRIRSGRHSRAAEAGDDYDVGDVVPDVRLLADSLTGHLHDSLLRERKYSESVSQNQTQ